MTTEEQILNQIAAEQSPAKRQLLADELFELRLAEGDPMPNGQLYHDGLFGSSY
jgi:hypothetical protein